MLSAGWGISETVQKRKDGLSYLKKESKQKPTSDIVQEHKFGDPRFDNLNNVMPILTELNQPNCNIVVDCLKTDAKSSYQARSNRIVATTPFTTSAFYDDIHEKTFAALSKSTSDATNLNMWQQP